MQNSRRNSKRKDSARKFVEKENQPIRLNKYIADSGVTSRRKADDLISKGVVKVNGKTVKELGTKVKKDDFVTVNGDPVNIVEKDIYIILNKPKDYITTTKDEKGRKTVFDIVKKRIRLFPVGRLDRNTTGVILLTNDGQLANQLTHPQNMIPRIYHAGLDKPLEPLDAKKIAEGVELEDGKTAPSEVFIFPEEKTKVRLTITEGKNREVRRIFEELGYGVKKLDRKEFATLTTKGLSRGEYRHLTRQEVELLKKVVNL